MTVIEAIRQFMAGVFADTSPKQIAVAVSGGGDSMALLCALHGWAQDSGTSLNAVSVNHGFRPEAEVELDLAGALCTKLNVRHTRLNWQWDGKGNLQDAARRGRRQVMIDWAATHNISHIALGHTADDQAETVLMRLTRGSGVDGLAGMAEVSHIDDISWLRPMLGLRRDDLRNFLTDRGIAWADDPTNEDDSYDRVRVRKLLAELEPMGLSVPRLTRSAEHMARARDGLRWAARGLVQDIVRQDHGSLYFKYDALRAAPTELATRILADALCWVSGNPYRPRYSALSEAAQTQKRSVLHGCLLVRCKDDLLITRELAVVADLRCDPTEIWDGRWRFCAKSQPDWQIAACGEEGMRQWQNWRDTGKSRDALVSCPAIWQNNTLVVPPLGTIDGKCAFDLTQTRRDFTKTL